KSDGLKPLTCRFVPPAGLEPAPYGLEVRHDPSGWYYPNASPQVGSGPPSGRSHRGRPPYQQPDCQRDCQPLQGPPAGPLATSSPMTSPNLSTAIDRWPSLGSSLALAVGTWGASH